MGIKDQKEKRSERVDLRLTLSQRQTLERAAKTVRRTMSSLHDEWIEGLAKAEGFSVD